MVADKKHALVTAMDMAFLSGHIPPFEKPEPEFHALGDAHRFDWAWPGQRLLVEVHGGTFSGGRHTRGAGFAKDRKKMRAAVLAGWRVLEYTTQEIERDPIGVAEEVSLALRMEEAHEGERNTVLD